MTILKKIAVVLCMANLGMVVASGGEQPRLVNAKLETRSAAGGLDATFRSVVQNQSQPAWIGYATPAVRGNHASCCCESWGGGISGGGFNLEGDRNFGMASDGSKQADLEAPENMLVLLRVADKKVMKIRTFSPECQLNVGGLPFIWLNDVRPAESVALLSTYVHAANDDEHEGGNVSSGALAAIALTGDPSADRALEQFVAPNQPESLRGKVTFWLGAARGRPGFESLQRIIQHDPSESVRKKAVFGLSVSHEPEAVATLITTARHDADSEVRGQALFWLAHKAGQKAAQAITDAIQNDPETGVKKRAVFALTQLPKDEGVPLLIQVARDNRNPEVRKQAMFWLGQSKDPRAVAFFEEVLAR